ncbi:hypothetical protein PpBr36_03380 [Pyricularia pennisetigena]|uniref:hypothetical protein n=1 Tax=Pyricularia pennisetigena TaxID=1578925 RepID=UPI00114FCBDE|nr:hypothetical protein PpBr36_03380 [Pyricularia pennisetigena]TLS30555.1 hypothetical protein PpBr36_03380 [Pyricularia pennisetigena]
MSSLKNRISAPLEAGTSILDAQTLPSHVNSALDYVSSRLARKGLHIPLVVVKRECELPRDETRASTQMPAELAAPLAAPSRMMPDVPPSRAATTGSSRKSAFKLKQLRARSNTQPLLASQRSPAAVVPDMQRRASADSPGINLATRQPFRPLPLESPGLIPSMPSTPSATSTTSSAASGSTQAPNEYGIYLVRAAALDSRAERTLRETIDKAERRFGIGTDWLHFPMEPAEVRATEELMRRSLRQREVMYSAEGLTLVSLDRLYTFKKALAAYSRTDDPMRLEDAVDELRRYVLANGRQPLQRVDLISAYAHVSFAETSLRDVARMYRRAYGGSAGESGIVCSGMINYVDSSDGTMSLPMALASNNNNNNNNNNQNNKKRNTNFRVGNSTCGVCDQGHFLVAVPDDEVSPLTPTVRTEGPLAKVGVAEPARPQIAELEAPMDASLLAGFQFTTPHTPPAPRQKQPPKVPLLRLQTSFDDGPVKKPVIDLESQKSPEEVAIGIAMTCDEAIYSDSESDSDGCELGDSVMTFYIDEGDLPTARPTEHPPQLPPWKMTPAFSIDEILNKRLSYFAPASPADNNNHLGPPTPRGYDDVSPITRNEWEFLRATDAWKTRTAAVETC